MGTDKLDTGESLYGSKWQKRRRIWLLSHPLCKYCQKIGRVTRATVVDHIIPHAGNADLFWDEKNWQSLCKPHHDSDKQSEEKKGYSNETGLDGWPTDDRHPANTGKLHIKPSKTARKLRKNQGGVVKK